MAARTPVVALLALLVLSPFAQAGTPRVSLDAYRIDMGPMEPGERKEGGVTLANHGPGSAFVSFLQDGDPLFARLAESLVVLAENETRRVRFEYAVPSSAPPGNHEEAVKLLVTDAPPQASGAGGTLVAGTALLLRSRTSAVGVLAIEAPPSVLPNESIRGRVLVVNAAQDDAEVAVRVALVAANGTTVRESALAPQPIIPGAAVAFAYEWPASATLPSGEHFVEATLTRVGGSAALAEGPFRLPLSVGLRQARQDLVALRDNGDGTATASVDLANTGTVPILLTPRVRFKALDGSGVEIDVDLEPVLLAPGESRRLDATLALPPGRFGAHLDTRESGSALVAPPATAALVMAPPRSPASLDGALGWVLGGLLLAGLVGLVAVGSVVVARRRRRAPRATPVPLARPIPLALHEDPASADAALDLFLARLEAEEGAAALTIPVHGPPSRRPHANEPIALFADPARLFGVPGHAGTSILLPELRELVADGRRVAHARAYYAAEDEPHATEARHLLARAGYEPHVRAGPGAPQEIRLLLALDAARAAREGLTVVLATHDATFAEVARRLREDGARCEIAGVEGRIPARLLAAADAVHALPEADRRPLRRQP